MDLYSDRAAALPPLNRYLARFDRINPLVEMLDQFRNMPRLTGKQLRNPALHLGNGHELPSIIEVDL